MTAGKLAEACAAFESSQAIDPKITTLVNHANCRELNHQLATAARLYAEASIQLRNASQGSAQQLRRLVSSRSLLLKPRLSTLVVRVDPANLVEGFEVLRGSVRIDATQWNLALPIDGGTYPLLARAPGMPVWTSTVKVGVESDVQIVSIPPLRPVTRPAATPSGPPDADADGFVDAVDRCPQDAETINSYADGDGCPDSRHPELSTLFFARGSYRFDTEAVIALEKIHKVLMKDNVLRVELSGYTSSNETGKGLSLKRASLVKEYLVRRGISESRLRVVGYRDEQPMSREPHAAENRRVELRLLPL
jgi:outer membrane protein OmpA-like peptidoglycan-associated protein